MAKIAHDSTTPRRLASISSTDSASDGEFLHRRSGGICSQGDRLTDSTLQHNSRPIAVTRHDGVMPLTPNDLANLVAIRSLRDLAAGQARAPGAVHRQAAVILLDAAIERTVFTAAEYLLGTFTDRDLVEKPLQALRGHGWIPDAGVETSRRRLHRVRNVVQHAGTGVDRDELPQWVIATERVIASVVTFAYGVDLDDVLYSSAVEDEKIREHLDFAEALMRSSDSAAAMASVVKAYDVVAGIWGSFVVSSNSKLAPRHARYEPGFGSIGGDDPKVVALQEVALLTAIAPEPSEAIWFLEAKQRPELLNLEEVQRALVFVFTFATAVEASPAARQEDRRRRRNKARRHERRFDDAHAKIRSYRAELTGDRTTVTLTLEDVPSPSEYNEWAGAISEELNGPWPGHRRFLIHEDGELVITEIEGDFATAMTRIEIALAGAESAVLARRATVASERAEEQQAEDEFRARVIAATPPVLPSWLRIGMIGDAHGPRQYAVQVQIDREAVRSYSDDMRQMFEEAGAPAYVARGGWVVSSMEPEEIPEFVVKFVPGVDAIIAKRNDAEAEREQQLRPVLEELTRRGYPRDVG